MPIPTYTPGYPPDGSSLGQTKATIRNNLDGTFQTLAIDHIDNNGQPGSNPAGYHTDIHMVPQGTWDSSTRTGNPAPIVGFAQLCALNWTPSYAGATADTQLFNVTGGGGVSQLTGNNSNQEGWAWMGGMLIQWGKVISTLQTDSVSFTGRSATGIDFPQNAFAITCTPHVTGPTNHVSEIYVQNLSTTGFTWYQADKATSQQGFYWVAIGQ
jgi:hypothetical protein